MDVQEFVNRVSAYRAEKNYTREKAVREALGDATMNDRIQIVMEFQEIAQAMLEVTVGDTLKQANDLSKQGDDPFNQVADIADTLFGKR